MRIAALIASITILTPWALAQRSVTTSVSVGRSALHPLRPGAEPGGGHARGFSRLNSRFNPTFPRTSLAFPFFGEGFSLDDLYSSGYPVASQPPEFLLQGGGMRESAEYYRRSETDHEPAPPQPLMIELQGGRYVRVNNAAIDGEALPLDLISQSSSSSGQGAGSGTPGIAMVSRPQNLPSTVLVFQDGRREEIRDYTIADGRIYARGDFYTDGYWNKKIELSALNIPQTLQANATRNVKFVLPSSPNEVITRP